MQSVAVTKENFYSIFSALPDNSVAKLERDEVYHVWEEDCIKLAGCYCSNTATREENPNGEKKAAIYLRGKKNIVIDGNGATLMIHGVCTPFAFIDCKNISLKNLTVDYFRPTMNEFTVLSNDDGEAVLQIQEECFYRVEGNELIWIGEKGRNGKPLWEHTYKNENTLSMYYNPSTHETKMMNRNEGDFRPSVPTFEQIQDEGEGLLRVRLKNKNDFLPVGCVIQSRWIVRDEVGGFFERCKNLNLSNLIIYSMYGLGLLSQYCKNVTYRNIRCVPKEGRMISSNADFFHFSGCSGAVKVIDCTAVGAHDDFINVHGTHLRIVERLGEKTLLLRFENVQSWGFQAFQCGDIVECIRWDTLCPYFRAKVIKYERKSDTTVALTVNKRLPVMEMGKDVIYNYTCNPTLLVQGNYYGPSVARGVLATTRKKVVVKNNTFDTNGGAALLIEDDCNFWFESGYTKNIIFKNNIVKGSGYGFTGKPVSVIKVSPKVMDEKFKGYVHGKIYIKKNSFLSPPQEGYTMEFSYVKQVKIHGNQAENSFKIQNKNVNSICLVEGRIK